MPIQSFSIYVVPYSELQPDDKFIIMDEGNLRNPSSEHAGLMPFICVRSDDVTAGWHTLFTLPEATTRMPLDSWKLPDDTLVMRVR